MVVVGGCLAVAVEDGMGWGGMGWGGMGCGGGGSGGNGGRGGFVGFAWWFWRRWGWLRPVAAMVSMPRTWRSLVYRRHCSPTVKRHGLTLGETVALRIVARAPPKTCGNSPRLPKSIWEPPQRPWGGFLKALWRFPKASWPRQVLGGFPRISATPIAMGSFPKTFRGGLWEAPKGVGESFGGGG